MKRAGFSLMELLVVIATIGLLAGLAIPAVSGILGGSNISLGAESVIGALSTGCQLAVTKQRDVEFRLIEMRDPSSPASSNAIRAVQILEIGESATNPIGMPRVLPSFVIIAGNVELSSLAAIREDAVWHRVKAALAKVGGQAAFDVVVALGVTTGKQLTGLQP